MPYDDFESHLMAAIHWDNLGDALYAGRQLSEGTAKYVDDLVAACLTRRATLPMGSVLFRARIMPVQSQFDSEPLALSQMGAPPPEAACHGRLNPRGEPVFYGAMDPETALAEIRPWVQARVTVATFAATHELNVVDLSRTGTEASSFDLGNWCSYILSRPIHRDDPVAYLSSQHLTRRLKAEGADGVIYSSRLKVRGVNIAVLNEGMLEARSAELREVDEVTYSSVRLAPDDPHRQLKGIDSLDS
jgi:RES domain-containing protein